LLSFSKQGLAESLPLTKNRSVYFFPILLCDGVHFLAYLIKHISLIVSVEMGRKVVGNITFASLASQLNI